MSDTIKLEEALTAYKGFENKAHELAQECSALFVNYKAAFTNDVIEKDEQEYVVLQAMKTAIGGVAGLFHDQVEKVSAKIEGIKSANKDKIVKFEVGKTYDTYDTRTYTVTTRYGSKNSLFIAMNNTMLFKIIGIVDGVEIAENTDGKRFAANNNLDLAYTTRIDAQQVKE